MMMFGHQVLKIQFQSL